jgi:hypothetical protein
VERAEREGLGGGLLAAVVGVVVEGGGLADGPHDGDADVGDGLEDGRQGGQRGAR